VIGFLWCRVYFCFLYHSRSLTRDTHSILNINPRQDDKKKKDKKKDKTSEGGGSDDDKKKKDKKDKDKKKDKKSSSSSKKKDKDGKDEGTNDVSFLDSFLFFIARHIHTILFFFFFLVVRAFSAENGKDYINDALFGKKQDDGLDVDDDDDDGSDDVSDDVAAGGGVDDEGALDLAVDATRKYIAEKGGPKAAASSPKDLVELVTNQQMASALKAQDKVTILALASITPATFFKEQEIAKLAPTFALLVNGNRIMERHLIAALEVLCVTKTKNFPVMLKQFYDEDVLSEEVILEWADDGRSDYTSSKVHEDVRAMLRAEAEPVVAWLQEADSDDDEDGDESGEED
jgi:translation initiation factor 5